MNSAKVSSWGIAILRMAVGIVFAVHGSQKLFLYGFSGTTQAFLHMGVPLAAVVAPMVALLEFFGGMALIVGVATRLFAMLLAMEMIGAILIVHGKNGFFLPSGFEYAFTLLAANIGLMLAGPGAAAVENLFGRKKRSAAEVRAAKVA